MKLCANLVDNLDEDLLSDYISGLQTRMAMGEAPMAANLGVATDLLAEVRRQRITAVESLRDSNPEVFAVEPTKLSQGEAPKSEMSFEDVQKAVQAALKGVPNAPDVEVLRDTSAFGASIPAGVIPKGATLPDGRVVVFANNADNGIDVVRTVFHELLHRGLKANFTQNKDYVATMLQLAATDKRIDALAREWKNTNDGEAKRAEFSENGPLSGDRLANYEALAVEEALARMSEDIYAGKISSDRGVLQNIAVALANLARKWGMNDLASWMRSLGATESEKFVLDMVAKAGSPANIGSTSLLLRAEDAKQNFATDLERVAASPVQEAAAKATATSFSELPGAATSVGKKLTQWLSDKQQSPLKLIWMTNDQIAESYKLEPLKKMMKAMGSMGSMANRSVERAAEVTKLWRALGEKVGIDVSNVMLRSTLAKANVSIKDGGKYLTAEQAWNHPSNAHLHLAGTESEKQAFFKLHSEFAALPEKAKKVYDSVRDDLANQRDEQRKAFFKQASEAYGAALGRSLTADQLEQLASSQGSVKDVAESFYGRRAMPNEIKAMSGLRESLRDVDSMYRDIRGPYFPLVRFGDHVVVMKSAEVNEADGARSEAKQVLQDLLDAHEEITAQQLPEYEAKVKVARQAYNEAVAASEKLKKAESNYSVQFFESPTQAEMARAELAKQYPGAKVYRTVREEYQRGVSGAAPGFMKKLEEVMSTAMDAGGQYDPNVKTQALKSVRDLWFQQSPERSALRSELSRRGIDGAKANQMINGYAQHSRANAWRTSRLQFQNDLTGSLAELGSMRENIDAMQVLNEMKRRTMSDMQAPKENKTLQQIGNVSYFYQLGLNASSMLTNATQTWVTSLPYMAGRHGVNATRRALAESSGTVIAMLKNATAESVRENGVLVGLQLRMTDDLLRKVAKNPGEYAMLKELTNSGELDITTKHDLGMVADGTSRIPGLTSVFEMSGILANYPELYNRLATSLAAYRLEEAKARETITNPDDVATEAVEYARKVLNRTHFNYSQENAPSIMRGPVARLVFQFKRYQQGMLYTYGKMMFDALGKTETDPERRKEAARSLAYTLGSVLTVSGMAGLPIAAPVALLAKIVAAAVGNDDDEDDYIQEGYNAIKDVLGETGGQVLGKGALAMFNVDLSGKIGQGSIMSPAAFANTDGKKVLSADYWKEIAVSLMGPSASLFFNMMEGAGLLNKGETSRGLERLLPRAAANLVQAYRYSNNGVTSLKGDVLMEPEDFNAADTILRGLGFAQVDVNDMYQQRTAFNNLAHQAKDARNNLLSRAASGEDVGDEIDGLNERSPEQAITPKDIMRQLEKRRKDRAARNEGIKVGKRDRGIYDRLTNDDE